VGRDEVQRKAGCRTSQRWMEGFCAEKSCRARRGRRGAPAPMSRSGLRSGGNSSARCRGVMSAIVASGPCGHAALREHDLGDAVKRTGDRPRRPRPRARASAATASATDSGRISQLKEARTTTPASRLSLHGICRRNLGIAVSQPILLARADVLLVPWRRDSPGSRGHTPDPGHK
jgi:hypothetical protein